MSAEMMKRIAEASPRFRARITAAFYLLTMLMAGLVLSVHGRFALPIDLIATAFYSAVTALFYGVSRPVNRGVPRPRAPNHDRSRPVQAGGMTD
jgi:hypothetical protein